MSDSGSVPTSILDFVSSRCSAASLMLASRTRMSRRAETRFQYARSTFETVSETVALSDAVPASLSSAAIRIARRAGSIERFWRSGCLTSIPRDVEYAGDRSAKKLFVRSRAPYAETATVPPVGSSAPMPAVAEAPSADGTISP